MRPTHGGDGGALGGGGYGAIRFLSIRSLYHGPLHGDGEVDDRLTRESHGDLRIPLRITLEGVPSDSGGARGE